MMTALYFAAHLLTWWQWLIVLIAVVVITATGLWPIFFGIVVKLLKLVPWTKWQTYAVAAVIAAPFVFHAWLRTHDHNIHVADDKVKDAAVAAEKKGRDDFWQAREDAANARYRVAVKKLEDDLATARVEAQLAQNDLDATLEAQQAELHSAFAELTKERAKHVTAEANRRCDLTRGVIVQFNAGAQRANGRASAAAAEPDRGTAASGAEVDDARSGISLDTYTDAVQRTQEALGVCRTQVAGWQQRERDVIQPWITKAVRGLQSCIPKGN